MVGIRLILFSFVFSQFEDIGLAAASTEHFEFKVVVIPAFAIEIVP